MIPVFVVFVAILLFFTKDNICSILILSYFPAINIIAYHIYHKDKKASIVNNWRVPEKTLHLLSLLGGWAGAALAHKYLHHKNKKIGFKMLFILSAAVNILFLSALCYIII